MTKTKSTKRALLMSALALLMCVSMLIGSTFAWFTDSVTSGNNKIQAGTLKIDLELLEKDGSWTSIKDSGKAIFDYDKWEPGYTDVKVLRVTNEGTLALKWIAKFVSESKLTDLANVIDVYVKEGVEEYPEERDDLSSWTKAGTVAEFVNTIETTTTGNLEAGATDYLGIALKMQETAGNKYQGMDLGGAFDIMILATQYTSESDSFDNQYDVNADFDYWDGSEADTDLENEGDVYYISTAAELAGLGQRVKGGETFTGKTVMLTTDIDLWNAAWTPIGAFGANDGNGNYSFNGTFDGNGHTIKNLYIGDEYANVDGVGLFASNAVYDDIVIKNLTVDGATVYGHKWVGVIQGYTYGTVMDCTVKNATIYAENGYRAGAVVGFVSSNATSAGAATGNNAENCVIYVSKTVTETSNAVVGTDTSANAAANIDTNKATDCEVIVGAIILDSADDLVALGGTKINGTYVLTADIDMAGKDMKSMVLSGGAVVNFNGNGHTISNLNLGAAKINGMTGAGNEVAGLFDLSAPATTVSLTVSDLTVKKATVSCSGYAAAIVGYNSNKNTVITLNNVDVDGAEITSDSVAALVAYSTGKVNLNDCDVKGLTLIGEENRPEKVGAYIGTANTADCVVTVTNCTNGTTYNDYGRVINGATYN